MSSTSTKLSFGEKFGYGLGDMAANFVFQAMMALQLNFYTETFGLTPAQAGTMFLVVGLGAAVFNPIMGVIADRTHTRWGRFRPWLLWTAAALWRHWHSDLHHAGSEPWREADLCLGHLPAAAPHLHHEQCALRLADRRDDRRSRTSATASHPTASSSPTARVLLCRAWRFPWWFTWATAAMPAAIS